MTVPRAFKAYLDVEEQKRKKERSEAVSTVPYQFISIPIYFISIRTLVHVRN